MRRERNESFDILPASQCAAGGRWYQGTADAVFQNLDILGGETVRLLSSDVRVNSYAELDGAVVLPGARIGRGARLRNVIVDAGVEIRAGLVVGEDAGADRRRFRRTERGVCLITQPMLDKLSA